MTITLKQDGNISRLVLDDPTRRNTLTVSMLEDMTAALEEAGSGHRTSVLELRGSGDVFCAGIDLDACHASSENTVALLTGLSEAIRRLRRLPQVVVAGVQGAAIAGGSALLTGCDFCCVEAEAKLGLSGDPRRTFGRGLRADLAGKDRHGGDQRARSRRAGDQWPGSGRTGPCGSTGRIDVGAG